MVGTGVTHQKGSNRVRLGPKDMGCWERKAFLHFRMASERKIFFKMLYISNIFFHKNPENF